ncbi:bifunctional protein GlmU isoform X1 [Oncorhynchus tshawytscha]|uniref:PPC domain-containing protein n=1 Tax=Oncorhynchus tshawytscha TaxID=74940 RepID=A0AAZ3SUJ1_ONCTS|nr:bifunctional protein GlmU isoform X1 [Oncorhynchus tshawytscha]
MASAGSALKVHAVRFGPGQELLCSLLAFVEERNLKAPFIITCVGSVTKATLRLANATAGNTNEVLGRDVGWQPAVMLLVIHLDERFEIVSLVGTLNKEAHLHICLADKEGKTLGGHVLGDLEVFTTAEVVIGEASDLLFDRQMDHRTGFPELVIQPRSEMN